jgi:1-acyl-sn-glycerol-3-phosphate acyltransferase
VDVAVDLARSGDVIAIFPEGARLRSDRVHRPRTGAARVALEANVPLVPASIRGTDGWRRFRRWEIAFGEPVRLDDLRLGDGGNAARDATRRLWDRIRRLLNG